VRIVYLVVSHRNPPQVLRLVGALREGHAAEVVVRHDRRRSPLDAPALERAGGRLLEDGIDVEWGHESHLRMLLGAMALIRRELDPDWLVVLSGQDYPLRPMGEIEARLEAAGEDAFLGNPWRLETRRMPPPPADEFFLRYAYWHARVPAKTPGPPRRLRPLAYLRELPPPLEPRIGVRAPRLPFGPGRGCWVSSDWPTLGRGGLAAVVRAAREQRRLVRHYRRTVSPAESFFATVLMNDPELRVSGDDRRFIRFSAGAPSPDLLTGADVERLLASGAHFARKFDAEADAEALDLLDESRRAAGPR